MYNVSFNSTEFNLSKSVLSFRRSGGKTHVPDNTETVSGNERAAITTVKKLLFLLNPKKI
jgi:hypothetical protein